MSAATSCAVECDDMVIHNCERTIDHAGEHRCRCGASWTTLAASDQPVKET